MERYRNHVTLLAHDDLEGRGTGQDGIDLAAGYIAGQLAAAGCQPGGPNGSYFQSFEVERGGKVLDDTILTVDGVDVSPVLHTDFSPFGFSASGDFDGDVVFVGYGITNADQDYDDYAGVDLKDKVALMLRREPPGWDPDGRATQHARFVSKMALAIQHGAAAVLVMNQDPGEDGIDGLMRFRLRGEVEQIPALHIKRDLTDKMLAAGGLDSITVLQEQLDNAGANRSAALTGVKVTGTVAYETKNLSTRNVIGLLPGNGPHADEYVVIGGHYDHLGVRRGRIYNGADDNASGTAGVIELAYALAAAPYRDRSVIFMAFSGEEIGLLGSKHYADHPVYDIESTVAMINMDMIGRLDHESEHNRLSIHGFATGSTLSDIVTRRSQQAGIDFIPDPSALGPSDHASFYRVGVPSLFFFTGVHDDYHQPGDDTEKVNFDGALQILNLVYDIALDIINDETAPQYVEVTKRARIFRGASRPVMGVMPDMDQPEGERGWRIAGVFPGGGAEKAGMQSGDRIIGVNGQPISDMSDYFTAIRGKKAGDTIAVEVLRGDKTIELSVTLQSR